MNSYYSSSNHNLLFHRDFTQVNTMVIVQQMCRNKYDGCHLRNPNTDHL